MCLIGALAAVSLLASDLARGLAWPFALIVLSHGAWSARRESRKPIRELVITANAARIEVDGEAVGDFRVDWRGVLAFARWRDARGRVDRMVWWPDTLPPDARRELRLAVPVETSPRDPASMAP